MSLRGDLRTIHLAEIFDLIGRGRQTGTLHVRRRSVHKWISFQDGRVYSTASNDPREYLGHFLVRQGLVSEEQLFAALVRQEAEGRPLGALLVEAGLLSEADLLAALRLKAEESCYDVFLWSTGTFEFVPGEPPPDFAIHLSLDVVAVILEGGRRADEWQRVRELIPSTATVFEATGDAPQGGLAEQVFLLARAGKTLAGIALALRRSELEVGVLLRDMLEAGRLRVKRVVSEDEEVDRSATVEKLLRDGRAALADGRVDDAGRAFEAVLLVDPLNQFAKKGLTEVVRAREGTRSAPPAPAAPPPGSHPGSPATDILDAVPEVAVDLDALGRRRLEPLEGFILSRINGSWTVRQILKLCPVAEEHARRCFEDLLARGYVRLR